MKLNVVKKKDNCFYPFDELSATEIAKFKQSQMYEMEIKRTRNPEFLKKAFVFFNFCFAHWNDENVFVDEYVSFDGFRKDLTILAGFYTKHYGIDGKLSIQARSISFGSMSEDEFRHCYNALINAALQHIFKTNDQSVQNQLMEFF